MKKTLLVIAVAMFSASSMAAMTVKTGGGYIVGDAISSVAYSEKYGLIVNYGTDSTARYRQITKEEGTKLAKKIAIGKSSDVIDLTKYGQM